MVHIFRVYDVARAVLVNAEECEAGGSFVDNRYVRTYSRRADKMIKNGNPYSKAKIWSM
jgi:hypothetical protein